MKNKIDLFPVKKLRPVKLKPIKPAKLVKTGVQLAVGMAALGIAIGAFESAGN